MSRLPPDGPQRRYLSTQSSVGIRTGFQRYERPIYDYPAKEAPCRAGCPAGHDIAWALYLLAQGRDDLAAETFQEDSPFPSITGRVCYHPCESACNRGFYDGAVAIHALERVLGDQGALEEMTRTPGMYPESVGIVGSGPAGLTAGYHLTRMGYAVTVYEAQDRPGGVLAYGIPSYRLPPEVVRREMDRLERLGLEFRCGVRIGRDLSLSDLQARHQVIFLGTGLQRPRTLSIPTPEDSRIMAGLTFLQQIARGEPPTLSGAVAVIGGGDVAIDAARSALRLGAAEVLLYCPEERDRMPAHPEEIGAAEAEGLRIRCRALPAAIHAGPGGLEVSFAPVAETRRQEDGSVHFIPGNISGPTETYSYVIYAVGQQAEFHFLPAPLSLGSRLEAGPWGDMVLPGIFAGGDAAGTYNVVNAIGAGKRAAVGIDTWLRGLPRQDLQQQIGIGTAGAISMKKYLSWRAGEFAPAARRLVPFGEVNLDYFPPLPREQPVHREWQAGSNSFQETNLALDKAAALREANRCFNCGMCNMCGNCFRYCPDSSVIQQEDWGFTIDLDHCKGCGICVQECPRSAMSMIPEREG